MKEKLGSKLWKRVVFCVFFLCSLLSAKEEESSPIRVAVVPAAGLGTRFLPLTKSIPKEMLPLDNKPAIQYVVEESINAGISQIYIVVEDGKQAIVNYFSPVYERERFVKARDKNLLERELNQAISKADIHYLLQLEPLGFGHAVSIAQNVVAPNTYFAVLLPDDILVGEDPAIGVMAALAEREKATVIAVEEVPLETISSYGVVSIKRQLTENVYEIDGLVEKPAFIDAPSNLAIVGRYILPSKIFPLLEEMPYSVTDPIDFLIKEGERVLVYKIPHRRFDLGTPRGWLKAAVYFGAHNPSYPVDIE